MSQQDYKPNSVLSDYLSVRDITIGIKRTTFLRQQVKKSINESSRLYPELVEGFVLAPNKDLAVSVQSCNWNRPVIRPGALLF